MHVDPLHYVFVDELKGLYAAELQLDGVLRQMARAASSDLLRTIFEDHRAEAKKQVERLEIVFEQIDEKPHARKNKTIAKLIAASEKLLRGNGSTDAALIDAARLVEQFEIREYGSVCTYAKLLGFDEASRLLKESLDEEEAIQQRLRELGESFSAVG
jgi:ferritin-like metal-binding protein YciE